MPEPQVIYAAANMQQAYLLKSVLADRGIVAIVANEMLQGGSGVDMVGWPTLARVVVAECDAVLARQIALEFDRRTAGGDDGDGPGETFSALSADDVAPWPTCPQCGARRSTVCPICRTAGSDFPPADLGYGGSGPGDGLGLGGLTAGDSPCCGPGGCSRPGEPRPSDVSLGPQESSPPRPLVLCPICDEPFAPQYPRRCESCGHEFAEGVAAAPPQIEAEPLNGRVFVALAAIVGLVLAAVFYLTALFRR